ncbi:MAG: LacI family DNA-binding transcriptional regulator [Elusimicrobiota bacterium]
MVKPKTRVSDIARLAGVSPSAVSFALNDRKGISPELRVKIKNTAAKLGYVKTTLSGKSKYISIVYAGAGGHIVSEIDSGITQALSKFGYSQIRYTFYKDEMMNDARKQSYLDGIMEEPGIAGMIVVFLSLTESQKKTVMERKLPVVFLNSSEPGAAGISIDDEKGGYLAAKKLIGLGHKKIGLVIPGIWYDAVWNLRKDGYIRALAEHGIEFNPGYIAEENSFTSDGSKVAAMGLIKRNPELTALIFASDLQAFYGIDVMKKNGIAVPGDISVIGFDNMVFCDLFEPPLTSLKMPFYQMGKAGAETLLDMLKGAPVPDGKILLEPEVVFRSSCKDISKK